jgi:predicted HAD superfamily Cof-like phosphohydrolase
MLNEVREFQKTGQQIVNDLPTVNSYNDCELRYKLMKEENLEYLGACYNNDKVEILDALVDKAYVLFGSINFHGMQDVFSEAFRRVHLNNMTKFPNGEVLRNSEGKIVKPEGFVPVDLSDLI